VPHGVSVVLGAPAVFRHTAAAAPGRHADLLRALGHAGALPGDEDVGEALAARLEALMRATGVPSGLEAVGLGEGDLPALTRGTLAQTRLLDNAPCAAGEPELTALFRGALAYW
jgi:alcohol dehydrogenase class IV